MANYTFKQFQAEYPNACLTSLLEINYGGTEIVCPDCKLRAAFHLRSKRRAYGSRCRSVPVVV
jgi:hypothetical protein